MKNTFDFRCQQRFNVMITRAKIFLTIAGDPHLLSANSNCYAHIEYCFEKQ